MSLWKPEKGEMQLKCPRVGTRPPCIHGGCLLLFGSFFYSKEAES